MINFIRKRKNKKFIENKIDEIHGETSLDIVADFLKMIHENGAAYADYLDSKYPITKSEFKSFEQIDIHNCEL